MKTLTLILGLATLTATASAQWFEPAAQWQLNQQIAGMHQQLAYGQFQADLKMNQHLQEAARQEREAARRQREIDRANEAHARELEEQDARAEQAMKERVQQQAEGMRNIFNQLPKEMQDHIRYQFLLKQMR